MKNLIVITLILFMFILPLVTSMLLDWQFVANHISRQIIVYVLMLLEAFVVMLLLIQYLKNIKS